ncbi:hypothetical protein A3C59_05430 [Candidatus Daviesbacteria bacterium RIFCSPHIGHO2_02_FULL_36_13]|uniref:Lipoprotein YerB n=1 Tax=Candidatus Daviesbacteria bacterium RIFCSPHIGHO2_02_FULL_36_13 TaxID=1797768 RepID=A0A1F5JZE0_9BACT|nr:MAG: hypothetical protein A3C59_05430 [Candidatus Daviesbacteria bacterium RIFCSPHIGHO2_02_FULL_36_13]
MNKLIEIFEGLSNIQRILMLVVLATFFFCLSTSVSASVFSNLRGGLPGKESTSVIPTPSNALTEDPNEPKTESCPLNGRMHTKKAKESWEKRRPLAVMIENHSESRPQSGLTSADVVYEAVAEGGITRFMALFYCNLSDIQVGPVRSARTYFLDWLGEYDALYAHVGGANTPGPADALGQIIKYKVKDLNQFSIGFPVFWRDYQRLGHPVATEHTMYSTTQKLWEIGAKRGWTATASGQLSWDKSFTPWKSKDDKAGGQVSKIEVNFWESQSGYQVDWEYDSTANAYKRKNGGDSHMDLNNNTQLVSKVVVVQFQKESHANDGYPGNVHLLYGTTGTGKALFFQDGNVVEGKWTKQSRTSRTKYTDSTGKEIQFNKGQIWIQTVPEGSEVTY